MFCNSQTDRASEKMGSDISSYDELDQSICFPSFDVVFMISCDTVSASYLDVKYL
jgi:hypothetical protein